MKKNYTLVIFAMFICNFLLAQNVGIGTPGPSEKLDVDGNIRIRGGELRFTDTDDLDDYIYGPVNRNLNVRIQANDNSDDFSVEINDGSSYVSEFSVNRNEAFFNGNVGIGTTAPFGSLNVRNTEVFDPADGLNASNSLVLYTSVSNAVGNHYGAIVWQGDATRKKAAITSVMEGTDSDILGLAFWTQRTDGPGDIQESMRLSHAGNVGIGVTEPTQKLDINGNIRVRALGAGYVRSDANGNFSVTSTIDWSDISNVPGDRWNGPNNTTDGIGRTGNVGIGTNSPNQALEVHGRIRIDNSNTELYQSGSRLHVRSENVNGVAQFASYGMYLPKSGETYNLYLAGKLKIGHSESGHIDINDGNTRITEGAGNSIRHQTNNGYIDIGPQNNGWGHIYTDRPGFYFNKAVRAGSGNVHLNESSGNSWVDAGNFGIGTTGPTQKLDVNGQLRIRGGSPSSGKVLTSLDGSGNASWEYPKKSYEQENVATNGTGWRRIAEVSGSAGRGFGSVSLYTTGGSYNPNYTTIHWYHNWSSEADIWVHAARGGNFWNEVRITDDGSNSYIEVNFTSDVDNLYTLTSEYGYRTATLYTGNLPAGGGDVRASASMESFNVSNDFRVAFNGNVSIGGAIDNNYKLMVYGKLRTNGINETSDARLKKNVKTLENALDKIMALRGVNYEWKKEEYPERNLSDGIELGVIAQEVEKILPEVVDTDSEGYKSVQYSHLVPVLIEALKEQQALINEKDDRIKLLEAKVERHEMFFQNIDMEKLNRDYSINQLSVDR
ncbi:MAG: tail fiber domain-containing protein [Chitinophagales bacterium]